MKRFRSKITAVVFVMLMLLVLTGSQAFAAAGWTQINLRFNAIAGETLATGDVACIKASDGKAYKADADDSNLRPAVGVIGKGASTGGTTEIIVSGILTGQTAASPGVRIFLSTTPGAKMLTSNSTIQPIGFVMPGVAGASTSTTYFIDVRMPSSPSAGY